ncbi:MAG TPA: potassium channel protein [Pirellulales bacterium]|nr:potassium channel protein [Pirellulales bacterium]
MNLKSLPRVERPWRFFLALAMPLVLVSVGTIGYHVIERWTLFDSLYMTVITLTTVGFREVHDLSPAGQTFTMLLSLGGVFTLFYAATSIIGFIVGGQVEKLLESRRMERSLSEQQSHFIVCGYGRMGRYVCQEFSRQGLPFVVVDNNAELLEPFELPHGIAVHGDAASDEILRRIGVERARALVSVVASDSDNLYITLSARLLNDRLFIVARADDERSEQKLLRAGASRVISPYVIGGNRMAQAVLRPAVVDFLELATRTEHLELNIEEAKVSEGSKLAGMTIAASPIEGEHKVILVAIKKPTGKMVFNPSSETRLERGDILIMLGGRHALDQIAALAKPGTG